MLQRQSSVTGNAVSEGSHAQGIQPTVRHPERKRGTSPKVMDHTSQLAQLIVRSRGPSPQKGVRDDTRGVREWRSRSRFCAVIPGDTRDLAQARGSHRLAYTRSSSGCLADIPQRLFVHVVTK